MYQRHGSVYVSITKNKPCLILLLRRKSMKQLAFPSRRRPGPLRRV